MLSKTLKLKKNLDKRKMTERGHRILHFVEIYYPTDFHANTGNTMQSDTKENFIFQLLEMIIQF